ncbi:MAG TPA: hypothetical protein VKF37_10825, partial [Chloroflexota bacterium]|nr:hypothetical protein [Chloroflexota bacterium]
MSFPLRWMRRLGCIIAGTTCLLFPCIPAIAARAEARVVPPWVACAVWQSVSGLGGEQLTAISAASRSDIWAVGTAGPEGSQRTLMAHWDGIRWQIAPSPNPPALDDRLFGVVAITANDAWAVGATLNRSSSRPEQPLIEHWDGRRWSVTPSPITPGNGDYYLYGVAADAPNDVWAVGTRAGGTATLIEHWDGRRWRIVPGARLGPDGGSLQSVAVLSADDVWAAGSVTGNYRTGLIEHWDGRRWYVVPEPALPAQYMYQYTYISSIAGVSRTDVWAVGGYEAIPGRAGPIIEHWDG